MMPLRFLLAIGLAFLSSGCPTSDPSGAKEPVARAASQEDASPAPSSSSSESEFLKVADAMVDRATREEPKTTAWMQTLASSIGAELVGLEHRLKTRDSIVRKLHLRVGPSRGPGTIVLEDTLRYKLRIEDKPLGSHTRLVAKVLRAAEEQGHQVHKVKNYWPRGDGYSGINSVLRTPSGLLWELQFHTSESLKTVVDTRKQYEELRAAETPLSRKRELYDDMTKAWDNVPIPERVLEPQSLHPIEEIRERERP